MKFRFLQAEAKPEPPLGEAAGGGVFPRPLEGKDHLDAQIPAFTKAGIVLAD
jgi:hypothetical protein